MSNPQTTSNRDTMKQTYQSDNFYNSNLGDNDYYQSQGVNSGIASKIDNKQQHDSPQQKQRDTVGHQPEQNRHDASNKLPGNPFSEEDRKLATYDPYWELKQGKSEKEVLAKLKGENSKLRNELKSVSEDLTMLLEKKKMKKNGKSMPVKDIVKNEGKSDEVIRNELETAQKQLERLQKEMDSMKSRFESEGTFDNYEKLKDSMFDKEAKATKINQDKKTLEKAIRETEKTLQVLCSEAEYNVRINALEAEVRLEREKLREVEKHTELLVQQTGKRKQAVGEIQNELKGVQSDMNKVSIKTKVSPNEIKKPESERLSTKQNISKEPVKINKKVPVSKFIQDDEAAPPCTSDNFEKLKKEIKILQKADYTKENNVESKLQTLRDELDKLMKTRDDSRQKVAEKSKEILILQTKSKDISRIVRHHAVAPLQREEREQHLKGSQIIPEVTIETGNRSKKNADKRQASPPPKEKQQAIGLTEYARQKFHTKGYRKDERGLLLKAGDGENWNDKDVCGKAKVKIIAIDVWHDDEVICGVQAVYEADKGDVIEGLPHVFNPEACKMTTFETLEEDYVKEISGFLDRKQTVIECLIFKTYRGDTMKIGKPSKDGKFFRFDINELEYPAILYGSNTQDKSGRGRLTRLGVLISSQIIEEVIKVDNKEETAEDKKDSEHKTTKEDDDHNKSVAKSVRSKKSDHNRSKRNDSDDEDEAHNKSKSRYSKGSKGSKGRDEDEEEEGEGEGEEEIEDELNGSQDERNSNPSGEAYDEEVEEDDQ